MSLYQATSRITSSIIKMLKVEALNKKHLSCQEHRHSVKIWKVKFKDQLKGERRALFQNLDQHNIVPRKKKLKIIA